MLYLHRLRAALDARLAREGRTALARACFDFLPHRAALDLAGWGEHGHLRALLTADERAPRPLDPDQLIATGRRVIGIEAAALGAARPRRSGARFAAAVDADAARRAGG